MTSDPHSAEPSAPPSDRVRLRRKPDRGRYDRATIDTILDAALVGHVGWVLDGQPYVTPTSIWRQGDRLYWHGSAASRMVRATKGGAAVCITASILDGLVLARSGLDHSVNYRSVMVLGRAHPVEGEAETLAALQSFVEHLYPGRWAELRPATPNEIRQTTVLWTDLAEASAKIRADGAHDEPGDETWPAWAGVIPVSLVARTPVPDQHVPAGMAAPSYLPPGGMRFER
ncbi:MAG: pyridoxamine 5'-phosphate oxidase family protein [Candidatus Limnocylindrales bacterium]|jgi:nitroimidazol reductase NimA-like FMN-containing flavoprotein (pyridoxamine 5'-phosphate oxidase superfamily)|nr:pyridoxamine 5'-phosphate oxidase family protein [Candidatus Limnocylindrales bacterium]